MAGVGVSHLQGRREGGRWSQAGLSMCGDLELRNRLRGAWEFEVWAVGVREGNGLGSLSWAPACRWRRLTRPHPEKLPEAVEEGWPGKAKRKHHKSSGLGGPGEAEA